MGSQIKGQATDDHNGTNVNGRSLLFFRFGIVVQNSFSGFQHKIYEHDVRDDMFLQLPIFFLIFFLITMHIEQFSCWITSNIV